MDALTKRRQAQRLATMFKIANNQIYINKHNNLHHADINNTCDAHEKIYVIIQSSTDSYKHLNSQHTIRNWSRLPQHKIVHLKIHE